MNLLKRKWLNLMGLSVTYSEGKMLVKNKSDSYKFLIYPRLFRSGKEKCIYLSISGKNVFGKQCKLIAVNRSRTILAKCDFNALFQKFYTLLKYFIIAIYVPAKSEIQIDEIVYSSTPLFSSDYSSFSSGTLLVTPGYPSSEDKYDTAFVHTRVRAYLSAGMDLDVLCINDTPCYKSYSYEGVNVVVANFFFLRKLLQEKKYTRILIHFFDQKYANVLESVDTTQTQLYFYLHGAETLYWDWPKINSPYFGQKSRIDDTLLEVFSIKDYYIHKYSQFKNALWIFVTPWAKKRCEELVGAQFLNSSSIASLVDTELFAYERKDPELRKNIFVLRKFHNINSYSLDTVVRVILELSHRPFFNDLQFNIYGDGDMHDRILAPVKSFRNVNITRSFLNHEQIRKVHESNGIALFPTRFDTLGISSCEAASSGCAVITSDVPGARQFIPDDLGVLCPPEDYCAYADVIEKMYNDPEYFLEVARRESESVQSKYDFEHTIQRELEMFSSENKIDTVDLSDIKDQPVLSIVVPAYNVEKTLNSTVCSVLDQPNVGKLEVIIVNDGSTDSTAEIAAALEKRFFAERPLVRVINKINGGHGSAINVGLEKAQGKYFRVIDGDDTVDSEELSRLICILENENSDIVLTNYVEDFAESNISVIKYPYQNLKPGIMYRFEDLCYPDYGFIKFGPILSCSCYKTDKLRAVNFRLLEKAFYVDMELNTYISIFSSTVTYYDLNVYRYLLGQENQSVSAASFIRNYKHHENVCFRMLEAYVLYSDKISEVRKSYIREQLIFPMLIFQYNLTINKMNSRKAFLSFDRRLSKYSEFYTEQKLCSREVKFARITKGLFLFGKQTM